MPFFDVEERELRRFPVEEKRPFPGEAQDGPVAEKRPFPGNVKRRWPEPQLGEGRAWRVPQGVLSGRDATRYVAVAGSGEPAK